MTSFKLDGVAKSPIYRVVAHFCFLDIPHVWSRKQKYTTPCISNFLLSHPETFFHLIKFAAICVLIMAIPVTYVAEAASIAVSLVPVRIMPTRNESGDKEFSKLLVVEGIRNLVAQEFYDTGFFALTEEKKEVIDQISPEPQAEPQPGAKVEVVIRRIRKARLRGFAGILGGAKTTLKITLEIILREPARAALHATGKAKATTKSVGAVFQVREDKVYFDQTATGQMVQRAVHDAVAKIIKERVE